MQQTVFNSNFSQTMDLFNEIDDLNDLFSLERFSKIDSVVEGFEDLQSKYSSLHENYEKEIENSKKVEKCLLKCLKFYSKLCKKYEVQQKLISNLEESIKEKISSLEEAQRNEERMRGLIDVYRAERNIYTGQTNCQLRKDKEILLDICCKLFCEPFNDNNIKNIIHLFLRKFKKDLDDAKINQLSKIKHFKLKFELESNDSENLRPDIRNCKNRFKSEVTLSQTTKVLKELEEKNDPLDLRISKMVIEESSAESVTAEMEKPEKTNIMSVEELCVIEDFSRKSQSEVSQECDLSESKGCDLDLIESNNEPISSEAILTSERCAEPSVVQISSGKSGSIFDIPDENITKHSEEENMAVEPEIFSGILFESKEKSEHGNSTNKTNLDLFDFEEESTFPYEKELQKIFREMSSIKLLSPIKEISNSFQQNRNCAVVLGANKNLEIKSKKSLKRNSDSEEMSCKRKHFKPEKENQNSNLLDSILSAMSIQNEEFKSKRLNSKGSEVKSKTEFRKLSPSKISVKKKQQNRDLNVQALGVRQSPRKMAENQKKIEKLVMDEIKNFVSAPIQSKEEADRNVKHCLSVLADKSEDVIAKCIVAVVLENIDEPVELFERPSPPLTKTQHRLTVLLSVFRTVDSNFEKISSKILTIIWEKLLPDNFFWPDDCVEAATRFYTALCRARNDTKSLWKFCVHGMSGMRQRCPLLMFTVLKTWPDVLHDASTLQKNILAVTIVNIFLHMPKKEGLRNFNQGRKLVALKHLLMNFYQFKVEDSLESYVKKVLDAVCKKEPRAERAAILLFTCRDENWTIKNVVPLLKSKLNDWAEGKLEDSVASTILSVLKSLCSFFQEDSEKGTIKDLICCLSKVLISAKKNHDSEVDLIEVLLKLKYYPEARKVIREWIPKKPINENLRNEIINVSADNILRELKLNRKREQKNQSMKKKSNSQKWKKSKEKKKKKKNHKKKERKSKDESTGISSLS